MLRELKFHYPTATTSVSVEGKCKVTNAILVERAIRYIESAHLAASRR